MKVGKILGGLIIALGILTFLSVIIEKNAGSGVVPYLPLPELSKKKATN